MVLSSTDHGFSTVGFYCELDFWKSTWTQFEKWRLNSDLRIDRTRMVHIEDKNIMKLYFLIFSRLSLLIFMKTQAIFDEIEAYILLSIKQTNCSQIERKIILCIVFHCFDSIYMLLFVFCQIFHFSINWTKIWRQNFLGIYQNRKCSGINSNSRKKWNNLTNKNLYLIRIQKKKALTPMCTAAVV